VTTLAVCSVLIGLVLGIRLRFLILVPIVFIGTVALTAISLAQGQTFVQAILAVAVFATLLQFGYVCTALLRSVAGHPRAIRTVSHAARMVAARKS
jgi:hypothetical protein